MRGIECGCLAKVKFVEEVVEEKEKVLGSRGGEGGIYSKI